jgi:hypothetical protein
MIVVPGTFLDAVEKLLHTAPPPKTAKDKAAFAKAKRIIKRTPKRPVEMLDEQAELRRMTGKKKGDAEEGALGGLSAITATKDRCWQPARRPVARLGVGIGHVWTLFHLRVPRAGGHRRQPCDGYSEDGLRQ